MVKVILSQKSLLHGETETMGKSSNISLLHLEWKPPPCPHLPKVLKRPDFRCIGKLKKLNKYKYKLGYLGEGVGEICMYC